MTLENNNILVKKHFPDRRIFANKTRNLGNSKENIFYNKFVMDGQKILLL